jgi:hypothetical protein
LLYSAGCWRRGIMTLSSLLSIRKSRGSPGNVDCRR